MAGQRNIGNGEVNMIGITDGQCTRSGVVLNQHPMTLNHPGDQHTLMFRNEQNNAFEDTGLFNSELLSPQQLAVQNMDMSGAGDASLLQNGDVNPYLLNLDISRGQLDKAQRFDGIGEPNGTGGNGEPDPNGLMDESLEQSMISENEADLLEQRQAIEQAKMVAHFKQLRGKQQRQQFELMRQQQRQIDQMREEREKVQRMLNNARQAQWGGGVPSNTSKLPPHPQTPKKTPKKGSRVLPTVPKHATPVKKGAGRPIPNIPSAPSTPSEYRMNGNPDLDSETASVYADHKLAQLIDGFAPLESDTASEDGNIGHVNSRLNGNGPGGVEHDDADGFVMRTGRLDFADNDTASQPDLESIHELTSSAWKNKSSGAIPSQEIPTSVPNNAQTLHGHGSHMNVPASAQNVPPPFMNAQPPPGYINLLHLPNMLQGLPPDILKQLLQLQQQGQSVVIDANGHLAVHDLSQGRVLPAAGMLSGLGLGGPPGPQPPAAGPNRENPGLSQPNSGPHQTVSGLHQHNAGPYSQQSGFQQTHLGAQQTNLGAQQTNLGAQQTNLGAQQTHLGVNQQGPNEEDSMFNFAQKHAMNQNDGAHSMSHPMDNIQSSLGFDPQESQRHLNPGGKSQQHRERHSQQLVNKSQTSNTRTQHVNEMLDFREVELDDLSNPTYKSQSDRQDQSKSTSSKRQALYQVSNDMEQQYDVSEEEADDRGNESMPSLHDESGEEEEPSVADDQPAETFDEQPVGGLGVKKTFEQLLEEELRREQERGGEAAAEPVAAPRAPAKKHFLKKGTGVARFGVNGKPPAERKAPPKKKSSKSSKTGSSQPPAASKGASGRGSAPVDPKNKSDSKQKRSSKMAAKSSKGRAEEKLELKRAQSKPPPAPPPPAHKQVFDATSDDVGTGTRPRQVKTKSEPKRKVNAREQRRRESSSDRQTDSSGHVSSEGDCVGEVSFQNRMTEIAHHEKVEEGELEEFEILEQYADDNASFLSSVSAVSRVLKGQDPRHRVLQNQRREQQKHRHASQPKTVEENESEADDTLADDIRSDEDADETLENTLKEEQHKPMDTHVPTLQANTGPKNLGDLDVSLSSSVGNTSLIATLKSLKTMQRKVASLDERAKSNETAMPERRTMYEDSTDEESDNNELLKNVNSHQTISQGPKRTSLDNEKNIVQTYESDSRKVEIVTEDEGERERDSEIDFGDEEAWDEDSRAEDDWDQVFLKAKSRDRAKPAQQPSANKAVDCEKEEAPSTPPTSHLVAKLFPKLKPQKPTLTQNQEDKLEQPQRSEIGDGVQAKLLRDKLAEMEREIERFRQENATLEKLRKEREEGLAHLKKEMTEFEKQKTEELKRIQDLKTEEMKKLKKERRVFEEYQKNMKNQPNKKEREEIEMLKQQVEDLQEEMKRKEQRWTSSTTRLRDRIDILEQENGELKEEIRLLEKKRLEAWQQREVQTGAAASAGPPSSKSLRDSFGSTHYTQNVTAPPASNQQLQKSTSGPQLSTRVKQPTPHKKSHHSMTRDRSLRLSQTDLRRSLQSLDSIDPTESESIRPEDSASNIASSHRSRRDRYSGGGMQEPRQSASLAASRESSMDRDVIRSAHKQAMGKKTSRKKAPTFTVATAVEKGDGQFEEIQHADGKVERVYNNGAREILFSNGTRKQVSADGQSIIVSFFNGDMKQILPDQRVVYYYSEAQTTHTTYPDGLEILQFPNNQVEKHYPDGTKEITFPDQTIKYLFPNGIEENLFPNGTVIRVETNGDKTMQFANGQREIHTGQYKRREYPDGTVKTVYPDGRQETRYSSGRIRVKDKDGAVVMDKRV